MKSLIFESDKNGQHSLHLPSPDDSVYTRILGTGGTAESFTVPAGANFVVFSADNDFYARYTGTAAVPSADVTDGTASEMNPTARNIKGVATISVVSATANCIVTATFYK